MSLWQNEPYSPRRLLQQRRTKSGRFGGGNDYCSNGKPDPGNSEEMVIIAAEAVVRIESDNKRLSKRIRIFARIMQRNEVIELRVEN